MKKQILLNVFYTVGIVVSVLGAKWGFESNQTAAGIFFCASTVLFIVLKVKLTKDFRKALKERANQE